MVDDSLARRAYRTLTLRIEETPSGSLLVRLPLVDGVDD